MLYTFGDATPTYVVMMENVSQESKGTLAPTEALVDALECGGCYEEQEYADLGAALLDIAGDFGTLTFTETQYALSVAYDAALVAALAELTA